MSSSFLSTRSKIYQCINDGAVMVAIDTLMTLMTLMILMTQMTLMTGLSLITLMTIMIFFFFTVFIVFDLLCPPSFVFITSKCSIFFNFFGFRIYD